MNFGPSGSMCVYVLSRIQLFATPWTVAHQTFLSVEFSRQEHWGGFPLPTPGVGVWVPVNQSNLAKKEWNWRNQPT